MKITERTRRESYEKLDSKRLYDRIIEVLSCDDHLTAKEIANGLYIRGYIPYPVRQAVAPRLTELEEKGIVKVVGKEYDAETGRTVAVYRLVQ